MKTKILLILIAASHLIQSQVIGGLDCQFVFDVQNPPKPELFLGICKDGEAYPINILSAQRKLIAKYADNVPIDALFTVISWEIYVSGNPRLITGTGSELTDEVINLIRSANSETKISITATVSGPDGIMRKCYATFVVI
jgi:hypothetical protein